MVNLGTLFTVTLIAVYISVLLRILMPLWTAGLANVAVTLLLLRVTQAVLSGSYSTTSPTYPSPLVVQPGIALSKLMPTFTLGLVIRHLFSNTKGGEISLPT
jgi:hypothetical protein